MNDFQIIDNAYLQNLFTRSGEIIDTLPLYQAATDLSVTDDSERNLYHLAANYLDHQAIAFLAEQGIKARSDQYGNTPLHALIQNLNDLKKIEEKKEDIYKITQQLINLKVNPKKKNDSGVSAIFEGGSKYLYPFIEALCDAEIKLDVIGEESKNILHNITSKIIYKANNKEAVDAAVKTIKILLEKGGIDPEDKDIFDTTPLTYAQRSGIEEVMVAFTKEDSSSPITGGMTLAEAVLNRNQSTLESIIATGTDLNEVFDQYNKTALMLACEYPSLDIVKTLIKAGADVNYKGGDGYTAVNFLITQAYHKLNIGVAGSQPVNIIRKILQTLIDSSLQVNDSVDNLGNTALGLLCAESDIGQQNNSMAEELMDAGCDINKANLSGITPLMAFAETGDENKHNIAELLIDNNVNTNLTDKNSFTALMYAATNSNKASGTRIAKLILDLDTSSIDKTNNNGETALDLAVKNDNEALVKLILTNM